jgi:hypothetical protein
MPEVPMLAGNNSDTNHPAIWLSSVESMRFENLSVANYPGTAVKLSINSINGRNGEGGCQQIEFRNFSAHIDQHPGLGPTVDVGSSTFWVWFRDFAIGGNASEAVRIGPEGLVRSANIVTVTTRRPHPFRLGDRVGIVGTTDPTFEGTHKVTGTTATTFTYQQSGLDAQAGGGAASSDRAQAVLMEPGTGTGASMYFQDGMVTAGGIKQYSGFSGIGLTVQNLNQENGMSPAVWIAACRGATFASILNVQPADVGVPIPGLRADCEASAAGGIVAQNTRVDGPATLAGGAGPHDPGMQPQLYHQAGVYRGHLIGQADDARRGFGPVATRWKNIASQDPTTWANRPCATTSVAVAPAPDGTFNAGKATSTACFLSGKADFHTGDWIVAGAWVRSETSGYVRSNPVTFQCMGCQTDPSAGYMHADFGGRGEWQWISALFHIIASSSPQVFFYGNASPSQPTDFFAPVLIDLPAGTVTANEAAEIATNLQTYREDAAPGQVSLLRGEEFKADSIEVGSGPTITSGVGPPKGQAVPGSVYLRSDGAAGSTLYLYKKDGWKAAF